MVIMSLAVLIYVGLVIRWTRGVAMRLELMAQERVFNESALSQQLVNRKESLCLEKTLLEGETIEIFTLYEITKEIIKTINEQEAFEIFKHRLGNHVGFAECLLLEPFSPAIKEYKTSREHFIFPLQGKKRRIGCLVIKGLSEGDKEKFTILASQFALALWRVKLYEEIERIAITDSLTDVYTRRYALGRFQEEVKRAGMRHTQLSFLMIDVDLFKDFNDKYGHLTGDQILREVGLLIKENIREIDIAGRYGGEEFCVILPDTDRQGAIYAAERIRQAVEKAVIKAYDAQVQITLSIGVSTYPHNAQGMEGLIDRADSALYAAKRDGRNRVCSP